MVKYKKIPNNENAIEIDGKVVLSFDTRYKEYLKWRDNNPELEKKLVVELEQDIKNNELYNNGVPHVVDKRSMWYREDGTLKINAEMKGDKYHGRVIQYTKSGTIKSNENFVNGDPTGKYKYYYENGNLRQSGCITNTFKNGEILSYHKDGTSKSLETYILGIRSGPQKYFYEDGIVSHEGKYKDNIRVGLWTWFWPNGEKLKEEQYVNKVLYQVSEWQDDGTVIAVKKYNNELLNGKSIFYHHNGNKSSVKTYKDGKLYGEYIDYFITGEKRSTGNMLYGMMDGKWMFWYHNGVKELECEFDFGNPVGSAKIYHDNGLLKEEVTL